MINLLLFILSFSIYFVIYWLLRRPQGVKSYRNTILSLAFLCMPFNINGNIFTVIGNAESEKNIFSILSFYQRAENSTFALFGVPIYQHAGNDAFTLIGVSIYQHAGNNAITFIGVSFYQHAENDAFIAIGVVGYQEAGRKTRLVVALAVYQYVIETENTRAFAICSSLE